MKLKTKKLILDLFLGFKGQPIAARDVVSACGLFGISENNARVTLARLSAEGLIESASRGQYRLTASAMELGEEVNAWREAEARIRPWQGDYIAAYTGMLGRVDRKALKRRQRALDLMGFRELEQNFHVRPNNIEKDLKEVRRKLHVLGLEKNSMLFIASNFTQEEEIRIHGLWETENLNATYREQTRALNDWLARYEELEPEVAARESFLLGNKAVRLIVFDPLLPNEFIDARARHEFFQAMMVFDRVGHEIWRGLEQGLPGMPGRQVRTRHWIH